MTTAADVTWWAYGVATAGYYVLGALWFTPLFGRAWDRSIGYDRTSEGGRFPVSYYVVPLISAAVVSLIIAVLAAAIGRGLAGSSLVGGAVGLAVASATVTNALTPHTPHPYRLAGITGGYHLTASIGVGVLLGVVQG